MARSAFAVVPLPLASKNLAATMFVAQVVPATPAPLLVTAPIVPATCVPCRLSSSGFPVVRQAQNLLRTRHPPRRFPHHQCYSRESHQDSARDLIANGGD